MQANKSRPQPGALRKALLVPVAVVICALMATTITSYWLSRGQQRRVRFREMTVALDIGRKHTIRTFEASLTALATVIGENSQWVAAFQGRDRAALLALAAPMFEALHSENGISHLYFHDIDRRVFLRVHRPREFGDVIDRPSLLQAERTQAVATGVEFGRFGGYTLRVVKPWKAGGETIGYIELGIDLENLVLRLPQMLNLQAYLLLDKRLIDRRMWERRSAEREQHRDWNLLPNHVLLGTSLGAEVPPMAATLANVTLGARDVEVRLADGRSLAIAVLPFADGTGRPLGLLVASADQTIERAQERDALWMTTVLVFLGGLLLFLLSFRYVQFLEQRLSRMRQQRDDFQREAMHDGLTGLLNRREFLNLAERFFVRHRTDGQSFAILMADIDHFKGVNDTHGHPVGDIVLREVAAVLAAHVRPGDFLGRYGGEEFCVLLPETELDGAAVVAERVRQAVQARGVATPDGAVHVTVSIGVAVWPTCGATVLDVVGAADQALYVAKNAGRNRSHAFDRSGVSLRESA